MYFLYVDVTSGLIIGLLDSGFNWIEYKDINEKKPSEIIHLEIFEMLKRHKIDKTRLEYFFSSGPGSYTGMRLGEGMAQMLEWGKEKVYSFYQFEVPSLMGIDKGYWIANAFKGQVFIYTWQDGHSSIDLVKTADFSIIETDNGFTLSNESALFAKLTTSKELIHKNPEVFFKMIHDMKMRKAPYYFRTLEEEFK